MSKQSCFFPESIIKIVYNGELESETCFLILHREVVLLRKNEKGEASFREWKMNV